MNKIYQNIQISFQMCTWMKSKINQHLFDHHVLHQHHLNYQHRDNNILGKNKWKCNKNGIKLAKNINQIINSPVKYQQNQQSYHHSSLQYPPPHLQNPIPPLFSPHDQNLPLYSANQQLFTQPIPSSLKKLKHKKCISKRTPSVHTDKLSQTQKILDYNQNNHLNFIQNQLTSTKKINTSIQNHIQDFQYPQLTQQFDNLKQDINKAVSTLRFKQIQSILLTKTQLLLPQKPHPPLTISNLSGVGPIYQSHQNDISQSFIDLLNNNRLFVQQIQQNCQQQISNIQMEIQIEMNKNFNHSS